MTKYCIDSDSLMYFNRHYPATKKMFTPIWGRFFQMVSEGQIVAPDEVFKEVEESGDSIQAPIPTII